MNNKLISPQPLWQSNGLFLLRVITGFLMAYHGLEVFDSNKMADYGKWDVIKVLPAPLFMVHLGKGLEFLSGILFIIGLFTRFAALFMAITMLFICFKVGGGKFYYEDQHPFLFALLALVFFFTGPVKWSMDQLLFKTKKTNRPF